MPSMNVISGIPPFDHLGEMPLIRFVKNVDFHYLQGPQGLRSIDRNGEAEVIEKVISDLCLKHRHMDSFSSAAICHSLQAYKILKLYGDVLLLINKDKVIVLDMDNIMCYITIPNNGGWHDKKNPRCQEYLSKAQRRVA